jgi:hypothetical protein
MTESARLPLARLLLVGALVPAVFSALDHWLLTRLEMRPSDTGHVVLTMAVFVVQIGLLGWLCGRLLENPWWRWGLYIWGWVLVDLQLLSAAVFADGGNYWNQGKLLPGSLFAAQVGLALIWAILGTTPWVIRLPLCAVVGLFLSLPLLGGYGFTRELFPVQMIALAVLCLLLRWQRFRLQRIQDLPPPAAGDVAARKQLQLAQFSIRHVLIWTTSLAIMLGVLRALDLLSLQALRPFFEQSMVTLLTAAILVAAVFVVAVWAALGAGSAWLRLPVLFLAMPPIGALLALFDWYSYPARFGGSGRDIFSLWTNSWAWQEFLDGHSWLAMWVYLAGSLLFASLLILRVLDYRLVRNTKPRPVVGVNGV